MNQNLKKLIKDFLIKSGFSGDTLESLISLLDNQFIDGEYKKIIKSEDNRIIKKIDGEYLKDLDEGWKILNNLISDFIEENKITYEDFVNNRFIKDKQSKKLFKYLLGNNLISKEMVELISSFSLPKKELYLVLSLNIEDFILSSTLNSWTSCLDINGGVHWNTLSGYLFDRNRAMIYLTDLKEKNFDGFKSLNMYNRAWTVLDENNKINANINYPTRMFYNIETINKILGTNNIKNLDNTFVSKYEIKHYFNDNDVFIFGYQDNTKFSSTSKTKLVFDERGGSFCITKDFYGNKNIIKKDTLYSEVDYKVITDSFYQSCEICGKKSSSIGFINKTNLCKECFHLQKHECCECGKKYKRSFITTEDETICSKCKKEEYTKCKICKRYFVSYGQTTCDRCFDEINNISKCSHCGKNEINKNNDFISFFNNNIFKPIIKNSCNDCFEKQCKKDKIYFCIECGIFTNYNNGNCPKCNSKLEL